MKRYAPLTIMLSDGGVSAVGQGACLPGAQTREVVLIPTERLAVSPGVNPNFYTILN